MRIMLKTALASLFMLALLQPAYARDHDGDGWRRGGHEEHEEHEWREHVAYRPYYAPVIVRSYYAPPRVVYYPQPVYPVYYAPPAYNISSFSFFIR